MIPIDIPRIQLRRQDEWACHQAAVAKDLREVEDEAGEPGMSKNFVKR